MFGSSASNPRVVIVGAGFAGLWAARRLARESNLDVTLIDRNNYHTFLPLLYQVAAAELEPEEIAYPLRGVFRASLCGRLLGRKPVVSTVMAEVRGIDTDRRMVLADDLELPYDHLVLAPGSLTSFFGTPGAQANSFTLKSLEEAVRLRNHLLTAFERASTLKGTVPDGSLTITVVGGGPTGVEYAGALAELIRTPLARDFPDLAPAKTRIVLVDASDEVLAGFPMNLRVYTRNKLIRMGVEVRTGVSVAEVTASAAKLSDGTLIPSRTVVWTAGVRGDDMAGAMNLPLGKTGRVTVMPTLQVAGHPEIHVAGDLSLPDGQNPPMVAPNATQQGRHAAENIVRMVRGEAARPFEYHDKGSMVTIGRKAAVVRIGERTFSGFPAWLLWLSVHLTYLIGFRNRMFVLINWAWDYLFAERAVRLILPKREWDPNLCAEEPPATARGNPEQESGVPPRAPASGAAGAGS